ncbi:MAG: hypothetical protein A2Z24_00345 [Candidatus Woykebacteria bacterium RBG_16_44_10]|uniref:Uncharacterized protein n=1 Tax=Candidatus Woykebacteria bacterium RBG_16_44_10 TaxID=1802597 RepID=A0A1G1WFG2_9BACT|nr:MAG: hypothetical protein A2Z24_00345 [Candidatus Woykebacteria bacterium RBG_16_44_10]
MKRILISLMTIAIVAVVGFAVTRAYFSDTETSTGNTLTAGTIDISVENGPDSSFIPVTITDMKPSYVRWTKHVVQNVGNNPLKLWKHIKDVKTDENEVNEPECQTYGGTWNGGTCDGGTPNNDIDKFIEYDMYIGGEVNGSSDNNWLGGQNTGGQVVISETAGVTIADIASVFVFLGELQPGKSIEVWQSYHMKDETGNWAQTDEMTFDIEFLGQQLNAPNPTSAVHGGTGPQSLLLENKEFATDWDPIIDGTWGVLHWAGDGNTFDFSATLEAHGLQPSTSYSLVYAPDPWPQGPLPGSPSTVLGSNTSDGSGNLTIAANPDLGYDIPHPSDTNSSTGGKIWLVLDADHNGTQMTGWNPSQYLFEYNLIKYDDTGT